ncbi:Hpt domain-containing protein [Azonexus sp. IMCC34842]|uniref:Hpt domain-containing protein n=1 Tax=Azonexus sp. IMCC34842 TaxID=3420950 RepID=UPI003D107781
MTGKFVLDKAAILERLGGDEDIFAMMLAMYLQDVDRYSANMAAAVASGAPAEVQREAHTIKGLLATFSDDLGAADASAIERKAKAGDMDGQEAAVQALQARLYHVAEILKAESLLPR